MGIVNLKISILAIVGFVNELNKALADGKLSFFEAIGMIPEASALAAIWPKMGEIQKEFDDLSYDEQDQLIAMIRNELNLGDRAEELVSLSLETVSNIYKIVQLAKK